jgi:thioredoxin reductase
MTERVIIAGGGPAGASCAIWLHKLGVHVLLIEAADKLGGLQRRSPYENLWIPGVQNRTGQQIAAALDAHVAALGVPVLRGCAVTQVSADGRRVTTTQGEFETRFFVIATGSKPRSGGFTASPTVAIGPGEAMEALDVRDKPVAILGGGDNAFDQARFVRDRGGLPTVFSRTPPRAQRLLQDMIADVPVMVGPYEADQTAMTVNDKPFAAFGVMYGFEAVIPNGLTPELENGYVRVDRFGETSLPGVYACGEVTDYWHPCVTTSAAHGIQVAKAISQRL